MDQGVIVFIRLLLERSIVTVGEASNELSVTRRQLLYRLEKINKLLSDEQYIPIMLGSQKEFLVDTSSRKFLVEFLFSQRDTLSYYFNREERKVFIFLRLFVANEYLSLQHFMSDMQISKTTIVQDISELGYDLREQEIELCNDRVNGYFLSASEMGLRRAMMKLVLKMITEERNHHVFDQFIERLHLDTFDYARLIIQELASTYDIVFVEDRLSEFIYIFIFLMARIVLNTQNHKMHYELPHVESIRAFKEFSFTEALIDYFPTRDKIDIYDRTYISSWILGISVGDVEDKSEDCLVIGKLVGKIMNRFELLSGVHYRDSESIFRHIFSHFRPAYYRLLFQLPINNPLKDRVMEEYPHLYALVKETMKPFREILNTEINDDECAYLTMHFSAVYSENLQAEKFKRKRALIVCLNGIGSSVILYNELRGLFPELDFYKPIEVSQFEVTAYPAEIVFTTKFFKELQGMNTPVVKVSPIMDTAERYEVYREVTAQLGIHGKKQPSIHEISQIIRKYVGTMPYEEQMITDIINSFMVSETQVNQSEETQVSLLDMVHEDLIQLKIEATDSFDAIRQAGALLVEHDYVSQDYIETILRIQQINPSYFVIAPQIALPHTTPDQGVYRRALGIVSLATPISFNDKEASEVSYIFFLAALDNQSHISAMSELLDLMNDPLFLELLSTEECPSRIMEYLEGR